ncbi:Chaperone protein dnaJ 49 [Apostasia shenzhenica]|uniref:Chaperone protein dnaJ 49 n=1 Tax=Apostasia shenzhenica TaxID=1088818 RepID=A0A2I0B7N5_9ASPA|nr:Chaperone protein dnaJ 49 [Apostasia shenzhenica]
MECNKDEALRAKEIAERKFNEKDYLGAKKFALKAQNLFPSLEGISQMITTFDVYLASEIKLNGEKDLYALLHLSALADEETVKKQYRKLALILHPDKNKSAGAEGAFQLISEAWNVLSDKSKKMVYDQKISVKGFHQKTSKSRKDNSAAYSANNGFYQFANSAAAKVRAQQNKSYKPPSVSTQLQTFWTSCGGCFMQYEYHRMYLNKSLLCPKCKQPFLATELPAPPSGVNPPQWSSTQQHSSTKYKNGSNVDSFASTNFQWGPFSGAAATAGLNNPSTTVAQAANVVHQAYEKAKRQREEAQSAARREEALRRRYNVSRRNASGTGNLNSVSGADRFGNRRRGSGEDSGDNICASQMDSFVGSSRNTISEAEKISETLRSRQSLRQTNFNREYTQVDVRALLIEKAKIGILKKIGELSSAEGGKVKIVDRTRKKQMLKVAEKEYVKEFPKKFSYSEFTEYPIRKNREVPGKYVRPDDNIDHMNKKTQQPLSIDVPDPDFYNFDNDRTEKAFGSDQVWATYDDDDGMPRYYAFIQKIISTRPFKVRMSFLTSKSNAEFGSLDWVSNGFRKTCGDFRVGRYEIIDTINIFSHRVKWEKGFRGVIKVLPQKGEIWALYRNWAPDWDERTPNDVVHKYEMVEVLEDYNESEGISVVPLVKVAGFKAVFLRHMDPKEIKKIPREEMFRFSHQVPFYVLTGEEANNAPKDCVELDPAATPFELLQVLTEMKDEDLINGVEQLSAS